LTPEQHRDRLVLRVSHQLGTTMGSWLNHPRSPLTMDELSLYGEGSQVTKEVYTLVLREQNFNSRVRIFREDMRMSTSLRRVRTP
jgi:hypothetical protein